MELCITKSHFTKVYNQSFQESVYLNGSQFKGMMRNGVIHFPKYPNLSFTLNADGDIRIFKKINNALEEFIIKYYDGAPAIEVLHEGKYVRLRPHRIIMDLFMGRLEQKVLPVEKQWDTNANTLNVYNMRFPYKGEHSKYINKKKKESHVDTENSNVDLNNDTLKNIQDSLKDVIGNIKDMANNVKQSNFKLPEIDFKIKEEGDKVLDKITEAYNSVKRNVTAQLDKLKPEQQSLTIQIGNKEVVITGQNIKVEITDK